MNIKIVNKSKNELPKCATEGSAGMDLMANISEPLMINPGDKQMIPTGIHIQLPPSFEAQIRPRSGLAAKHGITVLNTPGTIDSDYTGEIKVILINLSKTPYVIHNGDRIAQMVISQYFTPTIEVVETLTETERGEGGFGSTGL